MGTPLALALVAAYLEYALTHLRWVPRPLRAALHMDLFEQPEQHVFFNSLLFLWGTSRAGSAPVPAGAPCPPPEV
jgi:hypothetical protein